MSINSHMLISHVTNDFKVIINNLTFNTTYAKYADDTTVLSVSPDVNVHFSQVRIFLLSEHNITL